jgi:drug/metabolite transporter (DMT)-like permease
MQRNVPPVRRATALLAVWGTVLFWGLSFVSSKAVLNTGMPPMTMVAIRFVIATVVLNIIARRVDPAARLRKKDLLPLALSGLFGLTIYFFFEARGIKLTSASHASLIIATIPVFTVIAEAVFYRTRISLLAALGIAISVAGVVFLVWRPGEKLASGSLVGDLLMLGACLSWVVYILLSKNLHKRLSEISITAYQSRFGTLFMIPLALLERSQWVPLTLVSGLNLAYLALFCSALSNFLYVYALSRLGPIVISPYVNLIPVVSVLGGVLILGEKLAWGQVVGGVLIIGGVLAVNWRQGGGRKQPIAPSPSGG